MLLSVLNDSPTVDEPPHILSGYAALKYGQAYIDPEHPLLAKTLASLPLLLQDIKFNKNDPDYKTQEADFDIGKMFAASQRFLNYSGNNPDGILLSTRIPMIFLTVLFGVFIFLFTKKLFGDLAALIATFFYATEPNILAHGGLVNTDLAGAGFILTTIFSLFLYWERQSTKRLAVLILSLSAALLSKYSAIFLVPLVLALMTIRYLTQSHRPIRHLIFVVLGVLLLISLFYGLISFADRGVLGFSPYQYFFGLATVQHELYTDLRFAYLLGEGYYGSRWYYFPILILAKTQIVLLASFILSLFLLVGKRLHLSLGQLVSLLLPPLFFLGLALTTKFNIGVRHVLPLYPFMIILGAASITVLSRVVITKLNKKIGLVVAGLLIFLFIGSRAWSIATTFPGYLSYCNFIFGGTENGWKVSNDSNYDWGQDVKRLADYVNKNSITSIASDIYPGAYATKYYKIPVTSISPKDTNYKGYLALSTFSITFHEHRKDNYSWVVDNYQPIAKAGYSIFIYEVR